MNFSWGDADKCLITKIESQGKTQVRILSKSNLENQWINWAYLPGYGWGVNLKEHGWLKGNCITKNPTPAWVIAHKNYRQLDCSESPPGNSADHSLSTGNNRCSSWGDKNKHLLTPDRELTEDVWDLLAWYLWYGQQSNNGYLTAEQLRIQCCSASEAGCTSSPNLVPESRRDRWSSLVFWPSICPGI